MLYIFQKVMNVLKKFTKIAVLISIPASIFLIAGCSYNHQDVDLEQFPPSISHTVDMYLDQYFLNPSFGGKVFVAHKILGTDQGKLYVWVFAQEFYVKGNMLEKGTGKSCPAVLKTGPGNAEEIDIIGHKLPRSGSLYSKDIRKMFPSEVQKAIHNIHGQTTIADLRDRAEEKAKQWFGLEEINDGQTKY